MNKQLQKQNLRALTKELFLNLMSVDGVMKKTIIRNFNNKKTEEKKHEYTEPRTFCKNIRI
jgi:hypothetical protein